MQGNVHAICGTCTCGVASHGSAIQFMLIERLLGLSCGFGRELLTSQLMPGATAVYVLGHLFFAVQGQLQGRTRCTAHTVHLPLGGLLIWRAMCGTGQLLTSSSAQPVTALPQGINVVTFFAFTQLIMAPTYRAAIAEGQPASEAARTAYDTGLASCLLLGLMELAVRSTHGGDACTRCREHSPPPIPVLHRASPSSRACAR